MIDKLYFLVHPLCYAGCEDEGHYPIPQPSFRTYLEYERIIQTRWNKAFSELGPNEVLVLLPIGSSKSQRKLEERVQQILNSRCVVIRAMPSTSGDFFPGMDQRFKACIADDLIAAFQTRGYEWRVQDMKVVVFSRAYAQEIESVLSQRGLTFDPETVQAEAWGESFEGCVTKWSNGIGTYLRLSNPIEKNFTMTVPDAPFILTSEFAECVHLKNDVRLFLFEGSDSFPIGLFLKASHKVWDRPLFIHLPADPSVFTVKEKMGKTIWPGRNGERTTGTGKEVVKVPVYGGSYSNEPVYIFGKLPGIPEFREYLVKAVMEEIDNE